MDFKTRKIKHKKVIKYRPTPAMRVEEFSEEHFEKKRKFRISIGIFSSIAILLLILIGIVKAISSIDVGVLLQIAGDDLETDAYGHTNFLLLGHGGGDHDGADLMDTIIVASLDKESKLITMISIPRDLYVKDDVVGSAKINEYYYNAKKYYGSSTEGIEHFKTKVEGIAGVPIHYWAKVNFAGFKEIIDAIGGISVNVSSSIYDPYYPKDGTYEYETFSLQAGPQILDGETALKYARSRKTTSDFDRANRQQEVLYAIKQKALESEILFSADKINAIFDVLKNNIETNITIKEILTLGSIAKDVDRSQIEHRLIHDDPNQCGGFLYTPERKYYNGQFVLIPAGGLDFIHLYADLNFSYPQIAKENSRIQILNGTAGGGIAGEAKQILNRFCFNIVRFGNARSKEITQTTYYYNSEQRPATLDFLEKMIPGLESKEIPPEYQEYMLDSDIILEIGQDYVDSENYYDDPFYYLQTIPSAE